VTKLINGHKLEEGEIVCPKCSGTGRDKVTAYGVLGCPKCHGYGYLDWVEMIVGKRTAWNFYFSGSGTVGIGTTCPQTKLEVRGEKC
jgi:DnaJ-class molecular chaperone